MNNNSHFKKTIAIAGPGQHFSLEIARKFKSEDAVIALMGRNQNKLLKVARDLEFESIPSEILIVDFKSQSSVESAMQHCRQNLPPWSSIIYNVKQSHHGGIYDCSTDEIISDFDSNVLGALRLIRSALEGWAHKKQASILISGGGYKDKPDSRKLSLAFSKAGVHTLALALQQETNIQKVHISEIIIDGAVRQEGPIFPADLAELYFKIHNSNSSQIVSFPQ